MEYRVLREKGTERPGTGEYNKFYPKDGHFVCAAPSCATPLYSAAAKFDSGCGWPAFDKIVEGSVVTQTDMSMGMKRIEIMCAKCGGHLGHVFEGERFTETNERHCVNSVSVKYVDAPLGEDVSEVKAVQPGTLPKKSDEGVSSTYRVPTDATSGGAHPLAVEQWAAPVSATRAPQGGVAATVGSELTEGEHYLGW